MRNKLLIIVPAAIALSGLAVATLQVASRQAPQQEIARRNPPPLVAPTTPLDKQIRAAQSMIERTPADPKGYNSLCAAYMKKARETGDFGFNARAEAALKRSFELTPPAENYDAVKLNAMLLLAYHRFGDALTAARRAQEMQPRDPQNYGAITDALVELGDYEEAFRSAQTMMDMRPGTSSYSRVSYLRELQGDTKGAIESMRAAAESAGDAETSAWCRVHLGDLLLNTNQPVNADHEFDNALGAFPDYHLALAGKARARIAAGDEDSAVEFYERSQARVPLPDTAIALGDLYIKVGRPDEAKKQFDLVEAIERAGSAQTRTYSRDLALFWADHDTRLDEALAVARRERAGRADIYTSDVLAWCLFKNGQHEEAKREMNQALRLGTRDARLLYHAGMIYNAIGDRRTARDYLKLALALNPSFDLRQAEVAKRTLRTIAV